MSFQELYEEKRYSIQNAVASIPKISKIAVGMAASAPYGLLKEIEAKIKTHDFNELTFYYMHSMQPMHETVLKYEYLDIVKPHPLFIGSVERDLCKKGLEEKKQTIYFVPANFSCVPNILLNSEIDYVILSVSKMDKSGFFSCGTNSDYTIPATRMGKKVIVEVNKNMPKGHGNCFIHISDVTAIVENNFPLPEIQQRESGKIDNEIGSYIVNLIPDRSVLQFGIGGVPNAICQMLTNHKNLGIHTELLSDGIIDLINSGAVTNKFKTIHPYKSVYTFAIGSKKTYEFIHDNYALEAHPVNYVNDPFVIAQNDGVVSVNSFLQIDLYGQVNAEFIRDQQYTGAGGQLDFVRGSQMSKNGKSILAAHSTTDNGAYSRVVPKLEGPSTDSRCDINYVITEFGVANLKGKSIQKRAEELIKISHPKFQNELELQAKKIGLL